MSNTTFFENVKQGKMSLGDIFSEVTRRVSSKDMAQVLIAGTEITTPSEKTMLAGWQKPFLFGRFFLAYLGFILLAFLMGSLLEYAGGYYLMLVSVPMLVPLTMLLLVWEMNVPRNISLYEVIKITAIGGLVALAATVLANRYSGSSLVIWEGLIEEPAKLIAICIFLRKKNYKYTLNGILIGAAVGTGFAIMESLCYVLGSLGDGMFRALSLVANEGVKFSRVLNGFETIWLETILNGLYAAIAHMVTAVSGHGIFAALYGGALAKAKGSDRLQLNHLFNLEFLAYFVVAILLHALHNYGLDLGLPVLLNGLLPCEYIIIAAAEVCLLLNTMRTGVNQIVEIAEKESVQPVPPMPVPAAAKRTIKVECLAGEAVGQRYSLKEGESATIGRSRRNNIALPGSEKVSGIHCKITASGGRLFVTDLDSTNGTYLDKQRLVPHQAVPVWNGSVIHLANKDCAFRISIQ